MAMPTSSVRPIEIGPQSASDSRFRARMRFHQSYYRSVVLGLPMGTGPGPRSTKRYGNMLASEDGARGCNFLTPEIFEVVKRRLEKGAGVVERYRLLHNMLSSQPMCFNLFGPLVNDAELATRLFAAAFPGEVDCVTRVAIEYAPQPAAEYLDDSTAFDAFVEYLRLDGSKGFFGVETKLTEPFSQKHYDRASYRRWMGAPDTPWLPEARDRAAAIEHNQLWRDHVLAEALRLHPASPYSAGRLLLVRHPGDHECAKTVAGYAGLLRPGQRSFVDLPLDELVSFWTPIAVGTANELWLAEFSRRYLDLAASEDAWKQR